MHVKRSLLEVPDEIKAVLELLEVPGAPTPSTYVDEDGDRNVDWKAGGFALHLFIVASDNSACLYGFDDDESRKGTCFFFDFDSIKDVPEEALTLSRAHLEIMASMKPFLISSLWEDPAVVGVPNSLMDGVL